LLGGAFWRRARHIKKTLNIVLLAALAAAAFWGWRRFSPAGRWSSMPYSDLPILVVDYTVPFETYREHTGLFWLLDYAKIRPPIPRPPGARADWGEPWQLARDYVGYRPTDREHPVRLAYVDHRSAEVIYVTDTYGVYKADLDNIESGIAHMDYTRLVFGGLSKGDGWALSDFVNHGGLLIAEFNTFCEPTPPEVRHDMEALFGVDWTEWVGRVFADPYDTNDVPHWLPREFAEQYPDRELPHSPILLLVARSGKLLVLAGSSIAEVAPRVVVSAEGAARFPKVEHDAPYYFWFSIMRERENTKVYARLKLPELEGAAALLDANGLRPTPPALTEHGVGPGRAIYFAGDFADIDFEPGVFDRENAIANNAWRIPAVTGMTTAPAFWRFYAPVMHQVLREAAAASAKRASANEH
jgi:hypothetical protein